MAPSLVTGFLADWWNAPTRLSCPIPLWFHCPIQVSWVGIEDVRHRCGTAPMYLRFPYRVEPVFPVVEVGVVGAGKYRSSRLSSPWC